MADELRIEPEPSSPLGERLRAQGGGQRSTAAIIAGAVGLAAFMTSLLQGWLRITLTSRAIDQGDGESFGPDDTAITLGQEHASFRVVYQLGVLALLALLAAVVLRPELAARLRLAAAGLGLAVAGVAGAILLQLRGYMDALSPFTPIQESYTETHQYLFGIYFAVGAIISLVAGVWLAAAPRAGVDAAAVPARGTGSPSGLARLTGGQAAIVAFVAGITGAGAFIASMLVTWQRIDPDHTTSIPGTSFNPGTDERLMNIGLADTGAGVVYLLGAGALLGLVGAVASRPGLAARVRPVASGLGLGLAAILVATIFEMRHWLVGRYGALSIFAFTDEARAEIDQLNYSFEPGVYLGFGAIVVLVAGVWLVVAPATAPVGAGVPAMADAAVPEGYVLVPASAVLAVPTSGIPTSPAPVDRPDGGRSTAAPAAPAQPPASVPVSGPAANWLTPVGYADGLTVTASDQIDIGGQSDILRS